MPLYMDTHQHIEGLTADAVAHAHEADLKTQENWPSVQKTTWFSQPNEDRRGPETRIHPAGRAG